MRIEAARYEGGELILTTYDHDARRQGAGVRARPRAVRVVRKP